MNLAIIEQLMASVGVITEPLLQQGTAFGGAGLANQDKFGSALALSSDGNTLAVLATAGGANQGIYVFTRSGNAYSQQTKIVTNVAGSGAVSLSDDGNTLAFVGASNSVKVYTRSAGVWTLQQSITPSGTLNAVSALHLSASGDTMIVGDSGQTSNAGAIYIFDRSAGVWAETIRIAGAASNKLGATVAISGNGLYAAAALNNSGINTRVNIYALSGTWALQDTVSKSGNDGTVNTVTLNTAGDVLAVTDHGNGNIIISTRSGASWTETGTFSVTGSPVAAMLTGAGDFIVYVKANTYLMGRRNGSTFTEFSVAVAVTVAGGALYLIAISRDGSTVVIGDTANPATNKGQVRIFVNSSLPV